MQESCVMPTETTTHHGPNGGATATPEQAPETPAQPPAEAAPSAQAAPPEKEAAPPRAHGGAVAFARRHPALTLIGAAGVGLFGGIEMAAGILVGAGVAAMLRLAGVRATEPGEHEAPEHVRGVLSKAPHELAQRARAMAQAARGKLPPS
jgi:hypothetical protein